MAYEVELVPSLFSSRLLIINEESIVYGDTQMMFSEVTALIYGTDQNATRLIGSRESYFIKLQDSSGDELEIEFYSTANLLLNAEIVHQEIINEMWSAFGLRIYNELMQKIKSGPLVQIGPIALNNKYLAFTVKGFFGGEEEHSVYWDDLDAKLRDNELILQSRSNKKAKITILPAREYNGMMLFDIYKEMTGHSLQ